MANLLHIERTDNKITLGTTDTTILINSHTASKTLALNADKELESIQSLVTTASPQFTGIELGHVSDTTITRVSAGVIAVEGTTVMMVGAAPTAHSIASHDDTTGTGAELNTLTDGSDVGALHSHAAAYQPLDTGLTNLAALGYVSDSMIKITAEDTYAIRTMAEVRTDLGLVIGTNVQAYDAELTSLAALSYVAASFIKMTGANTFALRTIGETADDLEATIDHDNLANGGAHDYAYVSGNDGATGITAAELEELSDGSATTLHSHAGGGDPEGDLPTLNDSESNAMLKAHAYRTQCAGFVTAFMTTNNSDAVKGFVDNSNDPAGAGQEVDRSTTSGASPSVSFFVGYESVTGIFFEITHSSQTPTITWTPLVAGGAAPIDQEL